MNPAIKGKKGKKKQKQPEPISPDPPTQSNKQKFLQFFCCCRRKKPAKHEVKFPANKLRSIPPFFDEDRKVKEVVKVVLEGDYEPDRDSPVRKSIKRFRDKRLAKVRVPYLVTPVKESEYVEGYRISSGLVIETTLYDKYKKPARE